MKQLGKFLNGQYTQHANLSVLLGNYFLREVDLERFEKKFGKMSQEELALFILDPANAYELSKFGHESCNYIMTGASYASFLDAQRVDVFCSGSDNPEYEEY